VTVAQLQKLRNIEWEEGSEL